MRTSYLGTLATALAAASFAVAAPAAQHAASFKPGQTLSGYVSATGAEPAPLHAQETHPTIEGSYMVILKDGVSTVDFFAHRAMITAAQQSANAFHATTADDAAGIGHIYELEQHLQGYAGKFTDDVVDYIRSLPEVAYVERDSVVKTMEMPYDESMIWDTPYDVSVDNVAIASDHQQAVEKGAPWVSGATPDRLLYLETSI